MMRKKHLLQNNTLNKLKEVENAKVTVQYIQEQHLIHKSSANNSNQQHMMSTGGASDDLEIENVEYLEENPSAEEYIDEPSEEKDEVEDNFYPNAIHCLLDLYKVKYENLKSEEPSLKMAQVWRDIAKDMQESLFEFNAQQIQQKYALLRVQYFSARSKEDTESFDYFEQLHDIYKDKGKESILKGLKEVTGSSVYYKDELLLQPELLESTEDHLHDFKSDEIVHKEHEFIDMVEKELQAMDVSIEDNKATTTIEIDIKDNHLADASKLKPESKSVDQQPQTPPSLKRARLATTICEEPPQRKQKLNEYNEINDIIEDTAPTVTQAINADYTLYHYNKQQERRHREKMYLLEKVLQTQERALELNQLLLQEFTKRLPS